MKPPIVLVAGAVGVLAIGISAAWQPRPVLLWNASRSVPIGLYSVHPIDELTVNELVVAQPPEPLATYLAERRFLPRGVPLLKHIDALPGSIVCRHGLFVSVDGVVRAEASEHDHAGRPLPVWAGCRTLAEGEVFLLNASEPASLDGRYFGPLPASTIVGRASPIWTEGR